MIAQVSTLAFFAGLAAAVHAPVGEPSGNAINAPLVEIVPACKPYTIKWTPSTPNTVSLLLLRGPSTNIVPLGAPLVEGIANLGSFVWTPSSSLEADTTHYGLQIIDDVTGQYQYSTQFGISKDLCEAEVVSTTAEVVSTTAEPVTEATATDEGYGYGYPTDTPEVSSTEEGGYTVPSSTVEVPVSSVSASVSSFVVTGTGSFVSSIIQPTKSLTVPASLKTTATGSPTTTAPPSEFTGAASGIQAGLGLAGAVAGLVFML